MFSASIITKYCNYAIWFVVIFFLYGCRLSGSSTFLIAEFLFLFYLVFILVILRSGIFKYVYEAPIYFLLFSFIYEFLKFPYYLGFDTPIRLVAASDLLSARYKVSDYYSDSIVLLMFQMVCIMIMIGAYSSFRKFKTLYYDSITYFKKEKRILIAMALMAIYCAISVYKVSGGNILFLLSRRSGNEEAHDVLKDNYLISLFSDVILVLVPIYISIKLLKNENWKRALFLYLPAAALSFLISGSRGFTIYSIITTLLLLSSFNKVHIRTLLPSIPFIAIAFGLLGLLRHSADTSENSVSENFRNQKSANGAWYLALSSYQTQLRDEMVMDHLTSSNMIYGASYMNLVTFPFPRAVLGDLKPDFQDYYVATLFWDRKDIGLPVSATTEAYLNFGYGGLFVFAIMGAIMALITNFLHNKRNNFYTCVGIVLLIYAGGWETTNLVYVLQILTILLFLIGFISKTRRFAKTPQISNIAHE